MVIKDGRFGPYVTDGETNASLRKGDDVLSITDERASELLADRRARGPVKEGGQEGSGERRPPRRLRAKKAATKATKKSSRDIRLRRRHQVHRPRELRRRRAAAQVDDLADVPAQRFGVQGVADRDRRCQHVAFLELRQLGQPGGLVDRVTDHRVLEAGLGADVPGDRPACGDPDAEVGLARARRSSSSCSSREAASAAPEASGCSIGAPKMASAASPWNLLTKPPWRFTVSTTTRKNSLSRLTTSAAGTGRRQLGRADQVDEQARRRRAPGRRVRCRVPARGGRRPRRRSGRTGPATAVVRPDRAPCR